MIDQRLGDGPFLFGDDLTLPDPYLFVMTGWAEKMHRASTVAEPRGFPRTDDAARRRFATCSSSKDCLRRNLRARAPAQ